MKVDRELVGTEMSIIISIYDFLKKKQKLQSLENCWYGNLCVW